jgi:hypothetical protein
MLGLPGIFTGMQKNLSDYSWDFSQFSIIDELAGRH